MEIKVKSKTEKGCNALMEYYNVSKKRVSRLFAVVSMIEQDPLTLSIKIKKLKGMPKVIMGTPQVKNIVAVSMKDTLSSYGATESDYEVIL